MTRHPRAYTLVEVIVAGAILMAGLVPIIHLITTSSTQAAKARDRAVALFIATGVAEERRFAPPPRSNLAPTPAGQVPHLRELVDAQRIEPGFDATGLDRTLANYTVSATVTGLAPTPVRVVVEWRESGELRRHVVDGTLGVP